MSDKVRGVHWIGAVPWVRPYAYQRGRPHCLRWSNGTSEGLVDNSWLGLPVQDSQ